MSIWPIPPAESSSFPFNPHEARRLSVYRAAVAAGFYTDELPSPYGDRRRADRSQPQTRSTRRAA
jgi:hypothetical protein